MSLFSSPSDDVLTSFEFPAAPLAKGQPVKVGRADSQKEALTLVTDRGTAADAADQFVVFPTGRFGMLDFADMGRLEPRVLEEQRAP